VSWRAGLPKGFLEGTSLVARSGWLPQTNLDFLGKLRLWIIAMLVLLVIFTPLAYVMNKGFLTILNP